MLLTYSQLNTQDLRGDTQADYLIALDADFHIQDGDAVLYREPSFPVVELARSLLIWLEDPRRADFSFDSMSFEEVGSVGVRLTPSGWMFQSVYSPESSSTPVAWVEVERCSREFVSRVERDLLALGLDPRELMGR